MTSTRTVMFALVVLAPALCVAQKKRKSTEDEVIPYSEQAEQEERDRRDLPDKSEPAREVREESSYESEERELSLADQDDPNVGLAIEALLGSMFLESSRGQGVEPRFMAGVRVTWEWSRTFLTDEYWREIFFLDATYQATNWGDGTKDVYANSAYHYLALAPAWSFPFGRSPASFYLQGGVGVNISTESLVVQGTETRLQGTKLLFQYGLGLRFRPALLANEKLRLSFRVELTRFRRGYMDDTFFGGSIGLSF